MSRWACSRSLLLGAFVIGHPVECLAVMDSPMRISFAASSAPR